MSRDRPRHRATRRLRTALAGITSAALTLALGYAGLGMTRTTWSTAERGVVPAGTSKVERLFQRNRCSATGFDEVIPARALIRRESGAVALVPFASGRAVHLGEEPGDLLAVCLGPAKGR
ncbi:hypothetical protein [Nocardioides sp. YIM 152588]|uniref:hypothetical protein n=1 Tax=Nocardioides sp. YIM 152588 TaxID=3158259 RepID=UPI0032E4A0EC